MKEVINNNNKYKWFAMLYMHGRKFMIVSVFTYQGLVKTSFFVIYFVMYIWVPIFCAPKSSYHLKNALNYPLKINHIHSTAS